MIMANHKLIIAEPYKDMIINPSQNNISQSKQIINYKCQLPLIKTNINYNTRYYIFEKYIIQPIKYQFLILKTPSFQMQHISIINQQPEQQYFCFLMIRTTPASIFGYVYFAINITFFLLICCQMMKLKRQGLFSRISLSLRILCIWSGLSLVQISYYQYTYYYLNKHPELSNEQKSTISSIEFIITFLQIFLIHTSLLLAPYYWHSNILDYLQNQSTIFDNQEQKIGFVANLKSNFDWIVKRFVHCYLITRAVLLFALIIVLCIFANSQNQQLKNHLAKITYVFALVDSFFMLIIYILGLIAIKNNIKLNSAMQDEQFKKIFKKYMLVIVTTLIRLIIFFIRNPFFGPLQSKFMTTNCQNAMKDEDQWKNLGFIIFQALIMDLLPAIIIYILYRVPKQNKQSLINQQRNSNQYIE